MHGLFGIPYGLSHSLTECYLSLHMQRYCELMHEESDSGEEKHIS